MTQVETGSRHDLVIVGGGPTGATAAFHAARQGLDVVVLERARHPRFHVGESFLPRNLQLMRELGLDDVLDEVPHVPKYGATFCIADEDHGTDFRFEDGLDGRDPGTFNVERAPFDAGLLERARRAGAWVVEDAGVREIVRLGDGDVAVGVVDREGNSREVAGRMLLDASGQATVVGRHLGTRRTLPDLKKVAYYGHYTGVDRSPGIRGGFPVVLMADEGWFWLIPIDDRRTSIGMVIDADRAATIDVPPKHRLAWGLSRCPAARRYVARASGPAENGVTADFSYVCEPYAGPGYFLVGDAATFVDPIFSTGVCLGMMSAVRAVDGAIAILRGDARAETVRRDYLRFVRGGTSVFFRLVRMYYRPEFRDLFLHGTGPFGVHRAVISVLSGHVFPRPSPSVLWRLRLFESFVRVQRWISLVPRRGRFSLLAGPDRPAGDTAAETARVSDGSR